MDLFKILADIHSRGLNDIFWLRNADSLQLDTGLALDLLDQHLGLRRVEGDASS